MEIRRLFFLWGGMNFVRGERNEIRCVFDRGRGRRRREKRRVIVRCGGETTIMKQPNTRMFVHVSTQTHTKNKITNRRLQCRREWQMNAHVDVRHTHIHLHEEKRKDSGLRQTPKTHTHTHGCVYLSLLAFPFLSSVRVDSLDTRDCFQSSLSFAFSLRARLR